MTGGEDLIDNVTLGKERVGKRGREWGDSGEERWRDSRVKPFL